MKTMYIDQVNNQVIIAEYLGGDQLDMVEVQPILPDHNSFNTKDIDKVVFAPCEIDLTAMEQRHQPTLPLAFVSDELKRAVAYFSDNEVIKVDVIISNESHARCYTLESDKRKVYIF